MALLQSSCIGLRLVAFSGCSSQCWVLICSVRLVCSGYTLFLLDTDMEHIMILNFDPKLTFNFWSNLIYVSGGNHI